MSSVSPKKFKFSLIISFQIFFDLPLPLLQSARFILSHLLTSASSLLPLTWPNHLNLVSPILCSILSNYFIPNFIHPRIIVHPTNHSHLYNHHPLNLRGFIWWNEACLMVKMILHPSHYNCLLFLFLLSQIICMFLYIDIKLKFFSLYTVYN